MLSKIRLQNFKCFENETISLAPFNLLTGLNGMGKSTLIQALLLLRQNYDLRVLDDRIALNGDLLQIGNCRDLLYQYFTSREIGIQITTDKNETASWKWNAEINTDYLPVKKEDIKINKAIFNQSLFNENFHYLHAERIGPRVYFETSTHKVMNQNQLGVSGEFTANYLSLFQNNPIPIEQLRHPNTEGLTLYEQINAWLGEIRPCTRISVSSNLDMSLIGLSYQFIGGLDAGNKFRPTNVGFGISYLLPVLVAVLSSKPGSLLLIENPEAHLHPKGQVQIGRLFLWLPQMGFRLFLKPTATIF